jgi:hypothetical protein
MTPLVAYTHSFITSLVFTSIIETAVLYALVRFVLKKNIATRDILFAGIFASFATIGYVWFVFPVFIPKSVMPSVVLSEPFVFLVEALFYRLYLKLSWRDALLASLAANLASYLGGPAIRWLGLWPVW